MCTIYVYDLCVRFMYTIYVYNLCIRFMCTIYVYDLLIIIIVRNMLKNKLK
jgi:hypothetical protein